MYTPGIVLDLVCELFSCMPSFLLHTFKAQCLFFYIRIYDALKPPRHSLAPFTALARSVIFQGSDRSRGLHYSECKGVATRGTRF